MFFHLTKLSALFVSKIELMYVNINQHFQKWIQKSIFPIYLEKIYINFHPDFYPNSQSSA